MAKRFDNRVAGSTKGSTLAKGLTTAAVVAGALLVSACGSGSGARPQAAADSAIMSMAGEMREAFCEGRSDDIVALLRGEPLTSPADRFYLALSLEQSGYALAARDIYRDLAGRQDAGSINVACGGESVVRGSVAESSLERLTAITLKLENFDIRPAPAVRLHDGLPTRTETAAASAKRSAARRGPVEPDPSITAPASASTSGLFFAHLTSYRAEENVQPGIQQLATFYPGLAGVLGSWQTASGSGSIWRVGVRTIDFNDAESLCAQVERGGAYCRVLDTTQ